MKLTWKQIEPFVKNPDPAARVVLVYGPDNGLMRERSKTISQSAVADINDPFNAVTLSGAQLADDPARLADEASAMSLMGGARLIRIEDATDKIAPLVKEYLAAPSAQNLVVIEAGALGARSALRKVCESAKNAAAIPCYVEDERDLGPTIRTMLREANLSIEPDALGLLASSIAGDRLRVRAEVEKLITYMGSGGGMVKTEDVQASCGDAGAQSLDVLVFGAGGGNTAAALRAYNTLMDEGVPVIVVLRALQGHFRRLHLAKARAERGEGVKEVMKSLSPPVFYKNENDFSGQMRRWSFKALESALNRLAALEAQCKQTGMPDETLCAQAVLSLSRSVRAA